MRNRLHASRPRRSDAAGSGRPLLLLACAWVFAAFSCALGGGLAAAGTAPRSPAFSLTARQAAFLDTLEERTFDFFWERSDSATGMTPDRWPTKSFVSVAAVGFALTAYPIGVERGYVTRADAARRVTDTLRFFWSAPQDSAGPATTGYRGFFYHFLDPETGYRFEKVELSTIDTALFLAGALFCQSYFDRPEEAEIRELADRLYKRVDWNWFVVRPPVISLGWSPEEGHLPYDWRGYSEAMILQILALGSPTHPLDGKTWDGWVEGYKWNTFAGYEGVQFSPLFGHQFSHIWIDFRGIRDSYMQERGIDYFENSRRATYAQRAYAITNPHAFSEYGENMWGLSACDGPLDRVLQLGGRKIEFHTYWGRGASAQEVLDDGTICPEASAGSIAFAPEIVIPALLAMRERYGAPLFSTYGFIDAFNPTLNIEIDTHHGKVVPGVAWFDTDYLGIDEGPIVAMLENYRSELVWRVMKKNPYIRHGLQVAGFHGGWLEEEEK